RSLTRPLPAPRPFPYTTLFRSYQPVGTTDSEKAFCVLMQGLREAFPGAQPPLPELFERVGELTRGITDHGVFNFLMSNGQALFRSEEHTSELQSRENLVCRLLL